jgi:hypothetical protein
VHRSSATIARSALTPPSTLTKPEAILFTKIVDANTHLKIRDVTLLSAFVVAVTKYEAFARVNDVPSWERAGRLMLALARGLRLLPTTARRTLTRMREDHHPSTIAAYLAEHPHIPEEDDDDRHIN